MRWTLAFRHLLLRPGRALVLLGGYGIGVAVMIVLLSVGEAMLAQARDTALVGGGELTVLPYGVDVEAMRSGGLTGMFFGIDRARFLTRVMLGGPRQAGLVDVVSPVLAEKLLEIRIGDSTWPVRAAGEIPSAATAAGAAWRVRAGAWRDDAGDSAWFAPTPQQFYDEIDRFHLPVPADSTWAEWDYANLVVSEHEWWYLTFMVAGDVAGGRGGGAVLVSHRLPDGHYQRYLTRVGPGDVAFDTARADLRIGGATVQQRDGRYRFQGAAGAVTFDFTLVPAPDRYFPPVELASGTLRSGYVVPALAGTASGRFCEDGRCRSLDEVPAYHDHNWGVWRAVTWEWGAGQGTSHDILYGGILRNDSIAPAATAPFFLALVDRFGVRQVFRFDRVERFGVHPVSPIAGVNAPDSMRLVGTAGPDSVQVTIRVGDATASPAATPGVDRLFLQMRGRWALRGRSAGVAVADSGAGFFETWVPRPR